MGNPRTVAPEYLRWLYPRFVGPDHYGQARELLVDNRSVLLTGLPGSGRRSAALMLLARLPGADNQIRELSDAFERSDLRGSDPFDELVWDTTAIDAGQRLLLDLSISEEKDNGTLLRELSSFCSIVRDRGAYLVVVLPHSWIYQPAAELRPSTVEIRRPDGMEVFQRYLRIDRVTFTRDQLAADELPMLLGSAPMRNIAELAELVRFAKESKPAQEFADWLGEALKALTEWSNEVAEQIQMLSAGQQRALLLATAMFSGAHADAIFVATSTLLKIVRHPEGDLPLLEQKGFKELLAEIDAIVDDYGRVGFKKLAYDRAVRTYFWADRPNLRGSFRRWVETTIRQQILTSEDRDAVAISFAEQALRTNRSDDLKSLAERWAKRADPRWPSRLLPQAVTVLKYGLSHERQGRFFRYLLYRWSTARSLSPDLAQVVVQVCSEVLALTDPKQAVVRLHHIFRRHTGEVESAAHNALLDLVNRDPRLCSYLLDRITCDRVTRDLRDATADTALFLELADPARLTAAFQQRPPLVEDVTVRAQLVSGWKIVLAAPSSPRCVVQVRVWLEACADDGFCDRLLDVLVDACDGQYDALNRLYRTARDWAYASDECRSERARIADRLNRKIDAAQGIDYDL